MLPSDAGTLAKIRMVQGSFPASTVMDEHTPTSAVTLTTVVFCFVSSNVLLLFAGKQIIFPLRGTSPPFLTRTNVPLESFSGWCRQAVRFSPAWHVSAGIEHLPPSPSPPAEAIAGSEELPGSDLFVGLFWPESKPGLGAGELSLDFVASRSREGFSYSQTGNAPDWRWRHGIETRRRIRKTRFFDILGDVSIWGDQRETRARDRES